MHSVGFCSSLACQLARTAMASDIVNAPRQLSEGARRGIFCVVVLRRRCRLVHLPQEDTTPHRIGYGHHTFLPRDLKSTRRTQGRSLRAKHQNVCPLTPGCVGNLISKIPINATPFSQPSKRFVLARRCGVRRRTVLGIDCDATGSLSAGQSLCGIS